MVPCAVPLDTALQRKNLLMPDAMLLDEALQHKNLIVQGVILGLYLVVLNFQLVVLGFQLVEAIGVAFAELNRMILLRANVRGNAHGSSHGSCSFPFLSFPL
jgi:hypothetical protein